LPPPKKMDGVTFPAVLKPNTTVSNFPDFIRAEKPRLESLLHKHGAILFRGFSPSTTPKDFNDAVEAFGYEDLPYIGGVATRGCVYGRVYTTNEAPPQAKISFHHEMAYLPKYPSKLFFFCEVPPTEGGETPIVPSHIVYDRMKYKHPEFVEKLEKHGLIYMNLTAGEDDKSYAGGRSWKSVFMTEDRKVAEQRAAKLGGKLVWRDDDSVITVMGPIPAIKYDEKRGRKIWFNSIALTYEACMDKGLDLSKMMTFGDGTPMPIGIVQDSIKILEEESVAFPWEKGDVLFVDNLTVLHARNSFTPPRRILASLC
ncbi:hypothetical protein M569_06916, partial [Genlisea aurea]